MNLNLKPSCLAALLAVAFLSACKKEEAGVPDPGVVPNTAATLKEAAPFPLGLAVDFTPFLNDAPYKAIVAREADNVTFSYQMKHGALVRDDGSLNFSQADQLVAAATAAGLEVFGHTLGWHANQNATYLHSLTAGAPSPTAPNLAANGGFEAGSGDAFDNWNKLNGAGSLTAADGGSLAHGGTRALQAVVAAGNPASPWQVQMASDEFDTQVGTTYNVTYWVRSGSAGGSVRASTQGGGESYQADIATTTDWKEVSWSFPAKSAKTRLLFDLGGKANTYYLDDVRVTDASSVAPVQGSEIAARVDEALHTFISQTVSHYKGKVKAWDVVNEAISDGGALRNKANSGEVTGTDTFFWFDYLGRDWALKAFQYAKAADPNALLFINDYNLEYSPVKLEALLAYVKELQGKGARIDGIGTQMHISTSTSQAAIAEMFRKLAATGLKVRVSELDVRLNPGDQALAPNDAARLSAQAAMYKFVVEAYIKNVPAAQRHGLTIWGLSDQDSWIVVYQKKNDLPLLFDKNYGKKPAYAAVLQALQSK